jgi:hypothetical protein
LKENHYKRIDDAKSRRRSNAVATIEIDTKAAISRTVNIISISINEKVEQIFVETTIWNSNQFRISMFRVLFKTFNLDSIKKKLMKTNKCFNCDESNHFNHDCSKFKKFKSLKWTWEMIQKNREKNNLR